MDWLEKVRNCSRQTQLQRLAAIRSFVRYGGIVDPVSYTHLDVYKRQAEQTGSEQQTEVQASETAFVISSAVTDVSFWLVTACSDAYTSVCCSEPVCSAANAFALLKVCLLYTSHDPSTAIHFWSLSFAVAVPDAFANTHTQSYFLLHVYKRQGLNSALPSVLCCGSGY